MNTSITTTTFSDESISRLRKEIKGKVLLPDDWGYNKARSTWNLSVDQHPALVVEVEDNTDVIKTIQFAGKQDVKVFVQSTGHGVIYPCNGQLLIRTSEMDDITINAEEKTAHIGAGALWDDVAKAAHKKGLAAMSGFSPTVSVVGYTLGGGFGWMVRKYGLAADSLLSVDMVTMSGEELHVTPQSHPELFGGLIGGGTSLGIITAIEIKLHQVKEIYTGKFYFLAEEAGSLLPLYAKWSAALPEEMTSALNIIKFPLMPGLPFKVMGKYMIVIEGCFLGTEEEGHRLFQPIRDAKPSKEEMEMLSYRKLGDFNGDPTSPQKEYMDSELLTQLSPELLQLFADKIAHDKESQMLAFELRHVGSTALLRQVRPYSLFSHRDTKYILSCRKPIAGTITYEQAKEDVLKFMDDIKPFATGHTYLNFLGYGDDRNRMRAAYTDENWKALQQLKDKYDPEGRLMSYIDMPEAQP